MRYTVNQLARLASVSVRTLHYYDQIGLLKPSYIEGNGYRYYEEKELIRLQQILFFRELEFPLDDIKQILRRPDYSVIEALKDQRKLMKLKRERIDALINSINKTIKRMNQNKHVPDEELYDAFKDNDVKRYQEEVKQRWGDTDAYKQSTAKVSKMTKKEMDDLKKEGEKFTQELADSMDKGPAHPDVQELIKKHHAGIEFFYNCPLPMYRNLGQMYVDDTRFTAYYDKFRPGLAVFMHDAITHFCDVNRK